MNENNILNKDIKKKINNKVYIKNCRVSKYYDFIITNKPIINKCYFYRFYEKPFRKPKVEIIYLK